MDFLIFEHQRSLKKGRRITLAFYLIFYSCFAVMWAYTFFIEKNQSGILIGVASLLIFGLMLPFLIWDIVRLKNGKGEWKIQITQNEVIWQTPEIAGEKGFRVLISDISKITCLQGSESDSYYIQTVGGEKYFLNPSSSGININKFVHVLKNLGVKYYLI